MRRSLTSAAALVAVAGLAAAVPADATTRKPAPKRGAYTLQLPPDPTPNATNTVGMDGCSGLSPASKDHHALAIPAKGTLKVVLDSPDPTGAGVTDWDLYVMESDGEIYDASHGGTSHEVTTSKFKRAQKVYIDVCNLAGQPDAKVSWVFTYA